MLLITRYMIMTIAERYQKCLDYWQEHEPNPETELHYRTPFELLVAVMLSAQCTDKRINQVTPALFESYPTPEFMARASEEEILDYIKSVSYPNSKARHLKAMATKLLADFGGEVPGTMQELTSLPGVGRKTANVVMGVAFGGDTIPVDTHVFRVSRRIGLASGKTPLEVEKTLLRHIPAHLRFRAHHWILLHGRYVCKAQKPQCETCKLQSACKHWQSKGKK